MIAEKVTCPGCDRKFNSVHTMTNHGRSIHWWSEKAIEAMKREHNMEHISMEKATGRPWKVNVANGHPTQDGIDDGKGNWIGYANKADAALIVRAVNSHEALTEALKKAYDRLKNCEGDKTPDGESRENIEELELIESALKLARGE